MKYYMRTMEALQSLVFRGLSLTEAGGEPAPGSAGNEIVHSATGTDFIVYNAGGDAIVYG